MHASSLSPLTKIAFCSERSIKFSSPTGEFTGSRYKVSRHRYSYIIPCIYGLKLNGKYITNISTMQVLIQVGEVLRANKSQNVKRPSLKYIEIPSADNFNFWFTRSLNYLRTSKYLQQAISQALCPTTPLI